VASHAYFAPLRLASREDMLEAALDVLRSNDAAIREVFGENVEYGIRGSLSTGIRYASQTPFDPSHFDVDAFIVSRDLPAGFSRKVMPNTMAVDELEAAIEAELRQLPGFEGLRPDPFGFRNWKREQPGSTMCK
jgi:hypothetical protein